MRITVFGSTGRTGRHILSDGPRRGHEIVAFTRRPELLMDTSALAAVVAGDGRDPEAVIAIVAAASRKGPHHTADVTRVITQAMAATGVTRLVVTSAYPIVGEKPRVPIAVLRLILADAYADQAGMERIVSGSSLNWTIARLNRLIDNPPRGGVRISTDLLDKPAATTRADAAATLLDLVENDAYARTAINVSGR
jgi:uncharacterized protein YbjT (DUF2867 family)